MDESLQPFFRPQSVVVIGVSRDPAKLGYGIAQNLVRGGYPGEIYFVNPRGGTLFERPIHRDVGEIPQGVDLAVLLIPAPLVPDVLAACGACGVRAAIIASGGFREVGVEGAALEAECLRVAREHGMRLMGPNCIGLIDTHLPLDTTFLPPPGPPPGDVAFISHSGAICAAIIDWARGQGFGFSRLVSLGNQVDVTETAVLQPVTSDPYTKVITLYLEGVADGRAFVAAAREVARDKPVVALKVGRSAAGQRAAASHTGALAGEENALAAALRRAGVLRAPTADTMFDWARALAWCPLPHGRRVAVLTNAGGPGVMAADALAAHGLHLADLQAETVESLHEELDTAASVVNPVDMLASATPQQYATSLRLLLADAGVDAVLLILPPPPMFTAGAVARLLIPIIQTAAKPVVVALMGHNLVQQAQAYFQAAQVATYPFPEQAAAALGALAQRVDFLARADEDGLRPSGIDGKRAERVLAEATPGFLSPEATQALLAAYGMAVPQTAVAQTADEAVYLALQAGFPVALKIASADIPHKSDVNGVLLNVRDAPAVARGFATLVQRARQARPEARIDGVVVQRLAPTGQDVIVGVVQDAQFGPVVMFGSGGVEVEGLRDVAFALAPLRESDLDYLLQKTWAGRKLAGYRHLPAADATAVRATLLRLGQLALDFPRLAEVEINPLRVLRPGEGVLALDVRTRWA